ncbi:glutamate racemase [Candidatus Saccharibacteria bacterium]|nr:glutamate racemase [Candidatus Saccharibacteria bacterium]
MKIGIFDSGLGGLIITHSVMTKLPDYDYVYLGDTARVPYGNRSMELVYQFTCEALGYLLGEADCALVIIACNTASAEALRRVQQTWLPGHYPDRNVLGVMVPTAEAVKELNKGRVGVLATVGTVATGTYVTEITKLSSAAAVTQSPAPLLVPLIENGGVRYAEPILRDYLQPLIEAKIDTLVLGCTHYPVLLEPIMRLMGSSVTIIAPNVILPPKLSDYLDRHPEIETKLGRDAIREFLVTDITPAATTLAATLFGEPVKLKLVKLD